MKIMNFEEMQKLRDIKIEELQEKEGKNTNARISFYEARKYLAYKLLSSYNIPLSVLTQNYV